MSFSQPTHVWLLQDGEKTANSGGSKPLPLSIVAVHDVDADCLRTWSVGPETPGGMWLRDLLPQKLPQARVLIFSYGVTSPDGTFEKQAEALARQLEFLRKTSPENTPIVMMGHGVGGLIIKQVIKTSEPLAYLYDIVNSTELIIFFGTPHHGMNAKATSKLDRDDALRVFQKQAIAYWYKQKSDSFSDISSPYTIANYYAIRSGPGTSGFVRAISYLAMCPIRLKFGSNLSNRSLITTHQQSLTRTCII
ncbi:hypothetical protein QBC42DRAFT_189620 [Cladorrhinum samala]|uniref:DUF676 domain-containing protein n=1 Tax=Cladorrhinum samala TaxID=585594 RepID=A0AAV9H989_9PEZI|nr:hypothetical protein QBC42DRAFT_189620 [Cladorrhinum samala]